MTVSALRSRGDPATWPARSLAPLRPPTSTTGQVVDKSPRQKSLSRREFKTRQRRGDDEREKEDSSSPDTAVAAAATSPAGGAAMDFSHFGFPSREWESFVAHNPAATIVPPIPSSIEELKAQANAVRIERGRAHVADECLADKFTTRDHAVPTRDGSAITMRVYRPAGVPEDQLLPALVWFHGGGFLFGSLDGETYVCGLLCHRLQCAVLHICYRHTPEFTHPTAHHDAHDGFDFICAHSVDLVIDRSRLIVGGISSGGQLAASVTYREILAARGGAAMGANGVQPQQRPRIRGQVLSIPWLCHRDAYPYHLFRDRGRASTQQCLWAPVTPKPRADLFTDLLHVEDVHGRLSNIAQASQDELTGTVRTALVSAGMDVKRDEGLMYALKLKSLGVETKVHVFPGLPHAFYMFPNLPSRPRYHEAVVECARWAFGDEPGQKEWYVEPPPREFAGDGAI
ncbi:hypothetical protein GGTG_00151 [Gaeumannomyces tritici R3-111a-1]|uniref:Alpha/beta hydrolase fold-3 domain-containing protein n=1 Tax=Gaeumannomyces tritici (strain R3-111a-1) TaxID=644352 RepID=J3NFV7_GAET3|nr:hypothetical protein GGTG_00151 [Gaeumannomyces tritici R3-111a-1]EJT80147.1 hypothetical protein GGTG_00151 [Gaeumannomyces tritici R3-111a-1]